MGNDFENFGTMFAGNSEFIDAKIVILGVGGAGNNAVDRMIEEGTFDDVKFISVNTDVNVLLNSKAPVKVQIGKKLTRGLGAGARWEVGKDSAEESIDEIKQVIDDADVLFITAGMGGGTGTGAAPVIAKCAKEKGILTIAVVSKPFAFEGSKKMRTAETGITELKESVDSLIVVPNNNIFKVFKDKAQMRDCFHKADEILMQSVSGIYDIIKKCGDINIDFADIRTIMTNRGIIHMGVGFGKGENRFKEALARATQNQLLETTIDGARAVLVQYYGDKLDMMEISNCGDEICAKADPNVELIFGTREATEVNDDMRDFVMITIIAADFAPESSTISPTEESFSSVISPDNFVKPVQPAQPVQSPYQFNPTVINSEPAPIAPKTEDSEFDPFDPLSGSDGGDGIPDFLRRPR